MGDPQLEFLTRRGCHLCDEALDIVHRLGINAAIVDVDLDLALLEEFDHRVPVLRDSHTGRIIAEGRFSQTAVRQSMNG